ncbi:Carboxymuconolactone decarboxylase [Desulfatibacillum aliphaticivorans]|uniref:Carboxymuconolactone decarboxylase n=1 Tax=Desulfatibacillum aliphaticivorans TaxID=218208 RepID=B8FLK9_DESAL|nr:carboxymuconolactone decarboxylase family protein [Desulfatibacillum aliphaticivorans]ACL05363.1 Carboxymuconolactone decarboxylase [Desulfatibacillum aliphaticivorans]
MTQQRIAMVNPPYEQETKEDLEKMMPPGIEPLKLFKTIAQNPRVLKKFRKGNLLGRGSIDHRDREIVILRTCARCGSEYEWGVHTAYFAERFGISQEQIAATVHGDGQSPCWEEKDRLLIRMVDELHDSAQISDDLWNGLAAAWNPDQLVELIVLTGFYHTVSFVTNGAKVELEEFAARFPDKA